MAEKEEDGAGGAVPNTSPENTDNDPPSRDSHDTSVQSVISEMEVVKREMTHMAQKVDTLYTNTQSEIRQI